MPGFVTPRSSLAQRVNFAYVEITITLLAAGKTLTLSFAKLTDQRLYLLASWWICFAPYRAEPASYSYTHTVDFYLLALNSFFCLFLKKGNNFFRREYFAVTTMNGWMIWQADKQMTHCPSNFQSSLEKS